MADFSNRSEIHGEHTDNSNEETFVRITDLPQNQSRSDTLSLRANFVWAFTGNAIGNFCAWLLLVILTKLGTVNVVGILAIAQAVAMPISLLFSLKLHIVQVTDAKNDYKLGHYLALRTLMAGLAVLVTVIIAFLCYAKYMAMVIALMAISYAIVSVREVFWAAMQKAERMDRIAISRILSGLLSLIMFGTIFWLSKSLALSIIGLMIARIIVLMHDIPFVREITSGVFDKLPTVSLRPLWSKRVLWDLTKLSSPLGLVAWLSAMFLSIPRLFLDKYYGIEQVGYFAAISSLSVAGSMVLTALGQTVTPRLAKYFVTNLRAYKILLVKLLCVGVFLAVSCVTITVLFGRQILTLLFKADYAEYYGILIRLSITWSVLFVFTFMNVGLQATRNFKLPVLIYSLAALTCGVFSFCLVPSHGMIGAVWSLFACYCVGFLGCSFFVNRAVIKQSK